MSARSEPRFIPGYQQFITHLRTPLYRNGYYLTLSSLATSGIGLIYWILAAHRYPAYLVGLNSAVIAAMTFLAGVAEFNLMSTLVRFVPIAGQSSKRLIIITYVISVIVAVIISIIFLQYLTELSPALDFLGDSPTIMIWFILSTMCWTIFVLQDSVLTGLRQAAFVPVENTVFSLTKIALMLIFAVSIPTLGIFASWSVALVVAILPTNYFIFRKLIPIHVRQNVQNNAAIVPRQVARFAAYDYIGALFWLICTTLMPVIVATVSGPTANAYFYLAWTIANTLYLIAPAMGSSLVVEASKEQKKLAFFSYKVFQNTMKMVMPAAVVLVVSASPILLVFGKGYSSQGANLLRLLALSAVPNVIIATFVSVARVKKYMKSIVVVLGTLCTLLLGSSYVLLKVYGIVGVGIGWVISETLVAAVVYVTRLRRLWNKADTEEMAAYNELSPVKVPSAMLSTIMSAASSLDIFGILPYAYRRWAVYKKQYQLSSILPQVIKQLPVNEQEGMQGTWKVQSVAHNETNTTVAFLGPVKDQSPFVIKLPRSPKEAESLNKQTENLASIRSEEQLGDWRQLLPTIISIGKIDRQAYFAERYIPGKPLHKVLHMPGLSRGAIELAAAEIDTLHRRTAREVLVDMELIDEWVEKPLMALSKVLGEDYFSNDQRPSIDKLKQELTGALFGRWVCVSWIHGDYAPSNILVDPINDCITGIVDWDLAHPSDLPLLDLLHLLISVRMDDQQEELGHVVANLLVESDWTPEEMKLIRAAEQDLPGSSLDLRSQLILTWLHHILANMSKTSRFDHHKMWINENILAVLKVL